MKKRNFIILSLILILTSCQSHDKYDYVKYREDKPSFFHLRHDSILNSDWIRQPKNLLMIHETFKDIGYENLIEQNSWDSNPAIFFGIYIKKKPKDLVDSLLITYSNYDSAPQYYSDFWKRRIKENNSMEVYKVLAEIRSAMNGENIEVNFNQVNDTLKMLVSIEYFVGEVTKSDVLQKIKYLERIGLHESIKNLVTHENHLYHSINFDLLEDSILARLDTATFYTYPWFEDTTP